MLYPGLGSLDKVRTLANRSKQFPTAISIVSPKIRYRPSLYAITCVFPPLTYRTTGSSAPVTTSPSLYAQHNDSLPQWVCSKSVTEPEQQQPQPVRRTHARPFSVTETINIVWSYLGRLEGRLDQWKDVLQMVLGSFSRKESMARWGDVGVSGV